MDEEILILSLEKLGLKPSENQIYLTNKLVNYTLEANKLFNLTSITNVDVFYEKMIIDSLIPLKYLNLTDKLVLDIGTGAGFPGLPLAIYSPKGDFYLLDSTKKRIDHISNFVNNYGLDNVHPVVSRAEDFAHGEFREKFDYVFARAVSNLSILLEISLPLLKVGGYFVAMKSRSGYEEIKNAEKCLKQFSSIIYETHVDFLPFSNEERLTIIIQKKKTSSHKFPRPFSLIKKKPF